MASTDKGDDWGFDPEPKGAPQHIPERVEPKATQVSGAVRPEDPSDRVSLVHTLATAAIGLLLVAWLAVIALSAWWVVTRLSG